MIEAAIVFLSAKGLYALLGMFWYALVFEIPRYFLSFFAGVTAYLFSSDEQLPLPEYERVSVIIAGLNEGDAIESCIRSLYEQSLKNMEIVVVDDGSTDDMFDKMLGLEKAGLITRALRSEIRGGKSSALNYAARMATGDILINVDCDCSFDRWALEEIIRPLSDPTIGAVAGNVLPRNAGSGLLPTFQAIEYLLSISLSKQVLQTYDQISCASGAFTAFRAEAWEAIGGMDAGAGEDFDITLRLRNAGWRIAFAPDALTLTDVPDKLLVLVRQRLRWERDGVLLRFRKHAYAFNPFNKAFRPAELIHHVEFLFFAVIGAFIFPFYMIWLFHTYGMFGGVILISSMVALSVIDMGIFILAILMSGRYSMLKLAPFVPGFALFTSYFMRFVRAWAYLDEWIFHRSEQDEFVPEKVRQCQWSRW